jgi:hypothetical protein
MRKPTVLFINETQSTVSLTLSTPLAKEAGIERLEPGERIYIFVHPEQTVRITEVVNNDR